MPSRNRARGGGLTQALDREVNQFVRNLIDNGLNFVTVYDEIRRSNSSLNRKPKKLLEDSIERVIGTIRQSTVESEPEMPAGDFDDLDAGVAPERPPSNALNRSIVDQWSTSMSKWSQNRQHPNTETQPIMTANKRAVNGEPVPKRRKATPAAVDRSPPSDITFADLGGIEDVIQLVKDLLVMPLTQSHVYKALGASPPRGILIHGPPGCGKTTVANAIAAEMGVNYIPISAPSIVSGMSGESEKVLRDYFDEAKRCAPCLMFIDEIDAITPKREGAQREMEKRIVAQLATCMDDLSLEKTDGKPVVVLAATNRPDVLDAAIRRGGRFAREINMTVPSELAREKILQALTRRMALASDIDFANLARRTPGFVGADLSDLVSAACDGAISRYQEYMELQAENHNIENDMSVDQEGTITAPPTRTLQSIVRYSQEHPIPIISNDSHSTIRITYSDFLTSLPKIQPSALREGFATIPSTTFADIGSLGAHIDDLMRTMITPILNPNLYSDLGIKPSSGTLLWGPPGNGKTLLAKAVANSSHANFISVKGPELLNKYVGESERAVRQVFARARSSVPVIIFFDELDALVPQRDGAMSEASARVVNTMLTELDGFGSSRDGIYIIGATNRPDVIDPAMLRPGRLETLLYVGLPDAEGRVDILKTLCKKLKNFIFTEEIANVARDCEGFSGADLDALLRRAGYAAIERCSAMGQRQGQAHDGGKLAGVTISAVDFELARTKVNPSVNADEMRRYDILQKEWGQKIG